MNLDEIIEVLERLVDAAGELEASPFVADRVTAEHDTAALNAAIAALRIQANNPLTTERVAELAQAEQDGRLVVLPPPGSDDFALCVVFRHVGEFFDASTKSVGDHNELLVALSHLACYVAEELGVSYRELLFSMSQQPSVAELVEDDVVKYTQNGGGGI